MRTVEVFFVIIILLSAFFITTQFAVLPSPRQAFGTNLRELAQSTLETLDAKGALSETIFKPLDDPAWGDLQKALSASLPPNIVYNLTVYDILSDENGAVTYNVIKSISNSPDLGAGSDSVSLLLTSPNVTYTQDPQKIQVDGQNITLYILNCNDANGWWITGYTGQSLAETFYALLAPYFGTTVLVNSTTELETLLTGNVLTDNPNERVEGAVVINTFGEAVPIPSTRADAYRPEFSRYCYFLGQRVREHNWNWVSIVGYPFYYVSNMDYFDDEDNGWGIYGMEDLNVKQAGLNAFLRGLAGLDYSYSTTDIKKEINVVYLTSEAIELCNYYGIYPNPYQTSSRALNESVLVGTYGLTATELFERSSDHPTYIPAATYRNDDGGAFTAIGLTRTPDPRVAALAILMYYRPTIYRSEFQASGTARLVTLQLAQQGGT